MKRALVLAGGGVAGTAWELGVPRGIQDIEPELHSMAAFGTNPLSPATRGPAARMGRVLGKSQAADPAMFRT
jgi:hypothetical protein